MKTKLTMVSINGTVIFINLPVSADGKVRIPYKFTGVRQGDCINMR